MPRAAPTPTKPSSLRPQPYRLRIFEIEDVRLLPPHEARNAVAKEVSSKTIEARKLDHARKLALEEIGARYKRTRSVSFAKDADGKIEIIAVGILPRTAKE